MDERTRRYYDLHAAEVADRQTSVPTPFAPYLAAAFPRQDRVLDIGMGAGRDLSHLVREGYRAYGLEPSDEVRREAIGRFPDLMTCIRRGALPDDLPSADELGGPLGGILCSAVLQHVPRAKLFDSVFAMKGLLRERGRVLVSIPVGREVDAESRDEHGRLFNRVTAAELELLFERAGFASIGRWDSDDAHERPGHRWATLLFELRFAGPTRPLDLIESVISPRERKVATYKLALVRALCDVAMTQQRCVAFRNDGRVAVPIEAVAERWILYYWPLFAAPGLLPQMNGEWSAGHHKLAFSRELDALVRRYRRSGQLSGFAVQRRTGDLPDDVRRLHRDLMRKLCRTIRTGPVTYAGGAFGERLFGHEPGQVIVSGSVWREISLMGHWVQDALLLRWAQLVSDLSKGEVPPERVVARLLVTPDPDRETSAARKTYKDALPLECVWSGVRISPTKLAIDHALPYSLWRNNDLWNLLPTHERVNASKSDDLPERSLLRARRDAIVHSWELSRDAYPRRFEAEARTQTAEGTVTLGSLFDALLESVEITALQRGCERWAP